MTEKRARERMVHEQLELRRVQDPRVLEAMRNVARHLFVPESLEERAYEDTALPIAGNQTISQPLIVGQMTSLLQLTGKERVLEIGTGSGYQTAILSALAQEIVTIERLPFLAERAADLLDWLGCANIVYHIGDGTLGYPDLAPYDRIIISAAAPTVPEPLVKQLALGGKMVVPVGSEEEQELMLIKKGTTGRVTREKHGRCSFVPLIGEHGWSDNPR